MATKFDKSKDIIGSSQIRKLEYATRERVLRVTFNNNSVYDYSNVPPSEYTLLISAHSVGSHFSAHVKNRYRYQRVS